VEQEKIIRGGYLAGLIIAVSIVFTAGIVTASILIYYRTDQSLNIHYSAIISSLMSLRDTLFSLSIRISLLVSVLTVGGLLIIGILYTHRIAGPVYRLKMIASSISRGEIGERVKFRKRDAIHPVADAFNYMIDVLGSDIREMRSILREVDEYLDSVDPDSEDRDRILGEIDARKIRLRSIINKYEI